MIEGRQLVLRESPHCGPCPVRHLCGEGQTELGCSPDFQPTNGFAHHVLHASSPDFLARIVECNGLDLDIDARPQNVPLLPPYFPQIRQWKRIEDLSGVAAVAIPLSGVIRLANAMQSMGSSAKSILGLTQNQQLVVTGFAHDRFLENAWLRPERTRLLKAIHAIEPDAAIAWGYSVWHYDSTGRPYPRPDHLYNLKRSLIVYASLQELGVAAIPHMYWGIRKDLDRWSEWLGDNISVSTISIDLQTVDSDTDWVGVMRDLSYFHDILPRDIRCVFNGICKAQRVQQLRELWPNSSLCNFGPFFAIVFPRKNLFGLPPIPNDGRRRSYTRIFHGMVDQYTNLMIEREPSAADNMPLEQADPSVLESSSSRLLKNAPIGANPAISRHGDDAPVIEDRLFPQPAGTPNATSPYQQAELPLLPPGAGQVHRSAFKGAA